MTADTFKFRVKVISEGSAEDVIHQLFVLISEANAQLLKRANGDLFDAVREAEDYLQNLRDFKQSLPDIYN